VREGEELKAPRHASAAATRNGNLLSRNGNLPHSRQLYLLLLLLLSLLNRVFSLYIYKE
jgi:hypothetical protein